MKDQRNYLLVNTYKTFLDNIGRSRRHCDYKNVHITNKRKKYEEEFTAERDF